MKQPALLAASLLMGVVTLASADEPTTAPATSPIATTVPIATTEPATQPATMPTSQPTTVPLMIDTAASRPTSAPALAPGVRSKTLPTDYSELTTRSIFMKGRVPPPREFGAPVGPSTMPTSMPSARAERKIVFVGVTETDGTPSAMFEDTAAGKIISCKSGESIATGKVTHITLDTITYEADGRALKIEVGQNLEGGDGPSLSARATITDNGNGAPTTNPVPGAAPSGDSGGGGGGSNDILERMRARRRAGQ